jgi:GT2 family glycosyltransferase
MKITILTPNYNGGRWLARCMDSVLSQELAPGDELEYPFSTAAARTIRWRSPKPAAAASRRSSAKRTPAPPMR